MTNNAETSPSTNWNPEVLENKVFMLFPFTFDAHSLLDDAACKKLQELVHSFRIIESNEFQKNTIDLFPNPYTPNETRLWRDLTGDATQDFFPFVRQIAGVPKVDDNINQQLFTHPIQVAEDALFSKNKGGKPRIFKAALKPAAAERCGNTKVHLQLAAPTIYGFASGTAILVMEWSYKALPTKKLCALDVLEGNYALCERHPKKLSTQEDAHEELNSQRLMEICRALLPSSIANQIVLERRFIYTGLRIAPELEESQKNVYTLASRLSKRETTAYEPATDNDLRGMISPFKNILHMAAIEGGCTMIQADNSAPEFLRNLIKDRIRNTYLPLALVSIHAHHWLLRMTQILPDSAQTKDAETEQRSLENLKTRLLHFQRTFHFPIASQISQHNDFHDLWQEKLQIDRQLQWQIELSTTLAAKVQETRMRWVGLISGIAGSFLVTRELFAAVIDKLTMNSFEWQQNLLTALLNGKTVDLKLTQTLHEAVSTANFLEWVAIGAPTLVAVIAGYIIYRIEFR